jgi:hypothetical protein
MDVQWSPEMEARLNDMDEIYRPLPPLKGNAVSMKIFDDHTRLVRGGGVRAHAYVHR